MLAKKLAFVSFGNLLEYLKFGTILQIQLHIEIKKRSGHGGNKVGCC